MVYLPHYEIDANELSAFYQECLARGERPSPQPAFMWQDRLDHALSIALTASDNFEIVSNYYAEMGRFRKAARAGAVALSLLLREGQFFFPQIDHNTLVSQGIIQSSTDNVKSVFFKSKIEDSLCPYIFQHSLCSVQSFFIADNGIAYAPLPQSVDIEGLAVAITEFNSAVISRSLESIFEIHFCTIVTYGPSRVLAAPLSLRTPSDVTRRLTHRAMTGAHFANWLIENRRLADYMDELGLLEAIPDSDYVDHSRKIVIYPEPRRKNTLEELEIFTLVKRIERLSEHASDQVLKKLDRQSQGMLLKTVKLPLIKAEIFSYILCEIITNRCFSEHNVADYPKLAQAVLDCFFHGQPDSPLALQIYDECLRALITDFCLFDPSEYLSCISNIGSLRERLSECLGIDSDRYRDPAVDEVLATYNVPLENLNFKPQLHTCHPLFPLSRAEAQVDSEMNLVMTIAETIAKYSFASLSLDETVVQDMTEKIGSLYMQLAMTQKKSTQRDLFLSVAATLGDRETKAYCARTEEICESIAATAMSRLDTSSREIFVASEGCRALFERFSSYENLLPTMKELVKKVETLLGQVHGVYLGLLIRLGQLYVRSGVDLQLREAAKVFSKAAGIASQLVELNLADDQEKQKYLELGDFSKMFFAETQAHVFLFDSALKANDELYLSSVAALLQRCLILRDYVATLAGAHKYAEALSVGAKWRRSLADLQKRVDSVTWRVFVAAERLRCEVWVMDKATIGDCWDALLLSENPNGYLPGVTERPALVKKVLGKYLREASDYNENKAERRIFLWEEGTRKLQVLDSGLKEAAELLLMETVEETSAQGFIKKLSCGDLQQKSIAVHVFACCAWMVPRLLGSSPTDKRVPTLGPILAVDELR